MKTKTQDELLSVNINIRQQPVIMNKIHITNSNIWKLPAEKRKN